MLKLVCSVTTMCTYQNWCVTMPVSLYMEWREGRALNLLKDLFHGTLASEKCPGGSCQNWVFLEDGMVWNGLSSVANKSCLLKWNINRDKLSSTTSVTLHCPNVSRESISKWDWM